MQNIIDSIIGTLCELSVEQIEEAQSKIASEESFTVQQKREFLVVCDLFISYKQMEARR